MTGVHEDISTLKDQELQLKVRSSQLEAAQRLGRIGSWYWDIVTDRVTWSHELFVMQGFDPDKPVPPAARHSELFTEKSWALLSAALEAVSTRGETYELELEMEQGKGPMGWMLARGEAVLDEFGDIVGVFGIAQDITARKHTEERLRTMAMQDDLSLLGNRAALNGYLDMALDTARESGEVVGCLMIDLDDFKFVNDTYGHAAGDQVIQIAANRLARLTRKSDTAFRLGGDEFVVVLDAIKSEASALTIGERIVSAFRDPISLENSQVTVNVSVGIAFSDADSSRSDLMRKADAALYHAKRTGKNQVVLHTPDLTDSNRHVTT
jgi:diguanylate cyclase (GGDEF)-like protein